MRSLSCPAAARRPGARRGPCGTRAHGADAAAPPSGAEKISQSARDFRRALGQSENYSRKHLRDEEAAAAMAAAGVGAVSAGGLVAAMKQAGNTHVRGDLTLRLAQSYGFCWGVERAVQMAYEARRQYPTEKMWITNEIIHNPSVNQRLAEMGVEFIQETVGGKDFSRVAGGEVVILPAFGASVQEMKLLSERGVQIVDTTCPWVSKVWNAVDAHARRRHTSIIHGKWAHEETVATASFATVYLIVKDLKEASFVAEYIAGGGDRGAFYARFAPQAMSAGFDPDSDLVRVGIANQTTMLKGETEQIGKLLQGAMMARYGVDGVNDHFMLLDTICDATQERQDAMFGLVAERPMDAILVVGGFNSSNTQHLQEIAEEAGVPSFWIDTAQRIGPGNVVAHKTAHGELVTTGDWLRTGPLTLGVTSGASTPDKVVEDALDEIFKIRDAQAAGAR